MAHGVSIHGGRRARRAHVLADPNPHPHSHPNPHTLTLTLTLNLTLTLTRTLTCSKMSVIAVTPAVASTW